MIDPNFGIQKWYLKPSFILRSLLGLFAIATLIRMFVIDSRLFKHVWRKPVHNGNIAVVLTFFFIITIAFTVLIHFDNIMEKIPKIGISPLKQIIIVGCIGGLTLLFALIFGGRNVSSKYFNRYCNPKNGFFWVYWNEHSHDKEFIKWSEKHKTEKEIQKYFKDRTSGPAKDVLGLFITMAVLEAVVLFYFSFERKENGFRPVSDQNDQNQYLSQNEYHDNDLINQNNDFEKQGQY